MPGLVSHFCKLFADDTKLIAIIKNPSDFTRLQVDINRVVDWAITWSMSFNEEKCKAMFFDKRRHNLLNSGFSCDANDDNDMPPGFHNALTMTDKNGIAHVLDESSTERDLGVMVHNRFLWHDQVAMAKSKAYAALGTLKRTFQHWTIESFRILYCTYVRPHLEYCSAAWGPFSLEDIRALEAVQNRATKLVPCLRPMPAEERCKELRILSLVDRRRRGDLIQFYKIYNGINQVNWSKTPSLAPALAQPGPASGLRGTAHRLEAPKINNCSAREQFLSNRVAADWSILPADLIIHDHNASPTANINNFKNKLDRFFIYLPKRAS